MNTQAATMFPAFVFTTWIAAFAWVVIRFV